MMGLWNTVMVLWLELSLVSRTAVVAWIGELVLLPLLVWIWDDRALRWGVTTGVVLQATAVFVTLASLWGWVRAFTVGLAVASMGWAVEFVGSRTGFPFGRYRYTDRLRPQVGHVPLAIPLAWLMMLPPAWGVARLISGGYGFAFVIVSALAFTAWDLFLDPQMVKWRLWIWEKPGGYFGIPWTNYLGWCLASGVMTVVLQPRELPEKPLVLIYTITWLLQSIGLGVFWKQPGPALCGFLGMGSLLAWAWVITR
jgi:putative membrane protein